MADDFKITSQKNNGGLHLELSGGFDRDAAMELLTFLKNEHPHVSRFYIDTHGLEHDNPLELILDEWSQNEAVRPNLKSVSFIS